MMGLKRLDWYIIGKFMSTFFLSILLIIGIVIIFDVSEKIDDFVQKEAPLKEIVVDYYLNFVPYFMNMYSPMFVFLTVIFFTSKMTAHSEIIAILSCGTSYHRMMVPYLVSAALLALLSLGLGLWVIPKANDTRVQFEQKYIKRMKVKNGRDIHYKLEGDKFVYVESFSTWNNTAYNFTLEQLSEGKMVSKLSAESAQWDSLSGSWKLKNWFIREYGEGLQDRIVSGKQMDTTLSLTVEDFYRNRFTIERLNQRDLDKLIKTQISRGDANVRDAQIEKNNRYSMPFSAFILTIIGVSLSTKKRRGGIGWNIAIGIALGFSYILFMKFSEMFVFTGALPASVAIWLPNIIYTGIAAVLYMIAPK
ncbi:MAG: LptF/LptG family permease [Bacteroidales bacterium]|nr:LptF/LptG family permease [Bacteroidales bacterium]